MFRVKRRHATWDPGPIPGGSTQEAWSPLLPTCFPMETANAIKGHIAEDAEEWRDAEE